jgi:hypothetical protein
MRRLVAKEVNKALKGLRLTSKDRVTHYIMVNRLPYARWSRILSDIVNARSDSMHQYGWCPRSTWLTEYREALALLLTDKPTTPSPKCQTLEMEGEHKP